MSSINLIIPTANRVPIILRHLKLLNAQDFPAPFSVWVVDDSVKGDFVQHWDKEPFETKYDLRILASEGRGPNAARNAPIDLIPDDDVVVFVGDDTWPTKTFVSDHWFFHNSLGGSLILQGYTPFHPSTYDQFMFFLANSGMQANWAALKLPNGHWKSNANGFCLTTNLSMRKSLFTEIGGFDERFTKPAWDDIDFGYRAANMGVETRFNPIVNYHYHKYNCHTFSLRQMMVGNEIMTILKKHPEMIPTMLDIGKVRSATKEKYKSALEDAVKAEAMYSHGETGEKAFTVKSELWQRAILSAMHLGTKERLENEKYWDILQFSSTHDEAIYITNTLSGIESGNMGWAAHSAQWLIDNSPESWIGHYLNGVVYYEFGIFDVARICFTESLQKEYNKQSEAMLSKGQQ